MMRYRDEAFEIESCFQDGKYRRGGKDSGAGDKRLKRKYKKVLMLFRRRFCPNSFSLLAAKSNSYCEEKKCCKSLHTIL